MHVEDLHITSELLTYKFHVAAYVVIICSDVQQ